MKYIIVQNWSSKDQAMLIAQSEADGIGKCVPTESLTGNMAFLELDETHFEEGGQFFGDADYETFDVVGIKEEIDNLVWTETPSEGGEI